MYFPKLEVLELLGQGGMGAVYKARQPKLDRLVALKVLPPEAARDSAFAERFTREARALARLNHANIVTVHDFGQVDGLYYFLMEYVDGSNLRQIMREGRLTPTQSLKLIPQICDALQFAHEEGIIHRDVKPENLLVDRKGRLKMADFGLAKLFGNRTGEYTLTGPWQVMGTLHYMAPEQMEHPLAVDHRADIYALGVVIYEMLTGQLPLGRFAPPSQRTPLDARIDRVVHRALEGDPGNRYQSMSEMKADLDAILGGLPVAVPVALGRSSTVALPFETGRVYRGFAKAHGLLRLEGDALIMEYEIKDKLFGLLRSAPRLSRIMAGDLHSIHLKKGWWTSEVTLRARRMAALVGFPGASGGEVVVDIARKDKKAAEQFVNEGMELLKAALPLRSQMEPAPAPALVHPARRKLWSMVQAAGSLIFQSRVKEELPADPSPPLPRPNRPS
jgi:tRNA A-37 threonylcarbamoyl transferase component Bud32